MIGVDWGDDGFRAYRLQDGAIRERRSTPLSLLRVANDDFAAVLFSQLGDWIADGERQILLCGMVGSRQGWHEAPYVPCPADADAIAAAMVALPFDGATIRLVPGLSDHDGNGVPDVMRGQETQLLGALDMIGDSGLVCMPGSHSKWVRIEDRRIAGFSTHLTGEAFNALSRHTILGRMMQEDVENDDAFISGVRRAGEAGGLLHHLFGVRALGLFGQLSEPTAAAYLSGVLIGHEVRAGLIDDGPVHLLGDPGLCGLYARAISLLGGRAHRLDADAVAAGLAKLGAMANWNHVE